MKGCLFLAMGSVVWRTRTVSVDGLAGMSRRLPWTMAAFTVAAISMVGFPPTAGFFSKWYLLQGAVEADAWVFAAALIVSSLLSAFYFFRVIERIYFTPARDTYVRRARRFEVPAGMLVPVVLLGIAVLLLGLFNDALVTGVIEAALPEL
jgi:multicomponent Na+:H+ antiporter subunit D